ncbi:MAG: LysM peptidoglycan-binding domain-containing protein [Myxococcaceae bacterium]|nr:LysM peptidoglycan-binding domain-containing protein [Myxococcaceae bacterium]MCA3011367.1 LysM peptidoglycan-binding domain-containing protein [Myxococcaceae bacterium]
MTAPISRTTSRPVSPSPSPSPAGPVTVQAGDTLSRIAQRHGTTVQALVDANRAAYPQLATNPGAIQVGWRLTLPGGQAPTAQQPAPAPAAGWRPRTNNDVVHFGVNEGASHEVSSLRQRGVNVTSIKDGAVDDRITTRDANGTTATHKLDTAEGARSFALTLGLPAEQTAKVADVLQHAGGDIRDELAQLAQVWAQAERGGQMPSRMVLSGHSTGRSVWGDGNGSLEFGTLAKLADAMPRAARSVQDLHLSACYSGGQGLMEQYRSIFPNAKTIWAYTGSAPGAHSGATTHLSRWEQATRGDVGALDRALAERTRKGENVAVWSADRGYLDGRPPAPLAQVRDDVEAGRPTFERFSRGDEAVSNPGAGPLREHYNQIQRLLQHPDLPRADRPAIEVQRDAAIRLLYFTKHVAPRFQAAHAGTVSEGFGSLGLQAPDFSTLSRADAMRVVAAFEQKARSTSPLPSAAQRLLPLLTDGLRDLKAAQIPDSWI